ncbi:putative vancomycin resistance protein [Saccharomonospora marina XMU15]|uniref:Putative vancomycin resistance protein n=1 Tax=Saccharomonospora marina XMU15 TaxID=882083 RepID=H5X1Z0_9PSEU|nr:VanW family protein [Saccharomonospora marina]EHR52059.1 putative vancomycin resistance protein [Saccharomonospora marina XMU15]
MPQDRQWPESHSEQTDVLPVVPPHPEGGAEQHGNEHAQHGNETTQHIPQTPPGPTAQSATTQDQATQHFTPQGQAPQGQAPQSHPTQNFSGQNFSAQDYPTQNFAAADSPTRDLRPVGEAAQATQATPAARAAQALKEWLRGKPALVTGAVLGALVLIYGVDLLVTNGDVPRGVTVAGVDVGGLSHAEAEDLLREQLEPRMNQPVTFVAGDVQDQFEPEQAGLRLDWKATLDQAGDQPLSPFTRIASFFTTTEVGVVTQAEPNQLENAMAALRNKIDRKPTEGNIVFEGATPVPVEPKQGQELEVERARATILAHWVSGQRLTLPVRSTPVTITPEAVNTAMEQIAKPAVSAPVVVHGEGADGSLEPEEIAAGLSFAAENGALVPKLDQKKIVAGVEEELASTEQEGKDATIVFDGGQPRVEPSVDGNQINWGETLKPLAEVLKKPDGRELTALYEKKPAKMTTEDANKLGIKEVVSEFTTGGFAADSGVNIRRVAEQVNGAIVKPGETFSLNGHTGPRTKAQGYVEAGIIDHGAPGKAVGGGISQFATTLYNASYFAGMTDAGHKEHSYYISRYPEGREATVFQNPDGSSVIDLRFTNDSPTGVAIQTIWTPSSITVRMWGTKHYDVQSVTGDRTNFVQPQTTDGPKENCVPSDGAPGFTVTDTRIIRDASTGAEIRRESRTVKYNPQNKIVCKKRDD